MFGGNWRCACWGCWWWWVLVVVVEFNRKDRNERDRNGTIRGSNRTMQGLHSDLPKDIKWIHLIAQGSVQRGPETLISASAVLHRVGGCWSVALSPFLTGRMFVGPNILRTLRRTMIRFLIELLVRRIWFGQSKLYFILNWLQWDASFGPNLRQTRSRQHDRKCRLKSSQVNIL